MSLYDIALFAHVVGAVLLFGGVALFQATGARLRGAGSAAEVRQWLGFARSAALLYPVASPTLLLSGLVLTASAWTFTTPWVALGIATLVALAAGGQGQRRRFQQIGRAAAEADPDALPAPLAELLVARRTWVPAFTSNGLAVGVLWLMTTKPGWLGSLVALAVCAGAGAALGAVVAARHATAEPVTAG